MKTDPWTSDDPQPGDFDDFIASIDPADVEVQPGHARARVRIVFDVDGDDAERLVRIARERGTTPHDLVADLLRDADPSAA
jgi:hypothetical protein